MSTWWPNTAENFDYICIVCGCVKHVRNGESLPHLCAVTVSLQGAQAA